MAFNRLLVCRMRRWSSALFVVALLTGCGGGGGGSNDISPTPNNPNPPAPGAITVSGTITFDRIPFGTTPGGGLNPNAAVESPARGIVVEAISGGSAIATATTNASGAYSLSVAGNTDIFIRAKAQMLKTGTAPTWNFQVLNNTNGDRLYALDGSTFNTGTANVTRNLRAPSGWNGTSYTETRAAAPFAVLDTVYQAVTLITTASSVQFEPLNLYWSATNRSGTTDSGGDPIVCYDDGDIQTTSYVSGVDEQSVDTCGDQVLAGIYVLGSVSGGVGDTDEFDQHVIAHEFGHYIEDKFSRSDSIGGEHAGNDLLDLRVAFGEGWGNAFSGMVLNNPIYRDSYGVDANEFGFNMEADDSSNEGWYSERSVTEILWDLFDTSNDGENLALPFGPIFGALNGGQRTTEALTSIFSFAEALRDAAPGQSSGINQLLGGEDIAVTDEFGAAEINHGGDPSVLPIYRPLAFNMPQPVCVSAEHGDYNKLGNNKFLLLNLGTNRTVTIRAQGAPNGVGTEAAVGPRIFLYRSGALVASGGLIDQQALAAGTYIVEVFDGDQTTGDLPRCMTVSATGV